MSNQVPVITSLDMALVEIERALQARLYYLALISTLSLIDLCAALEDENGETDQPRFRAWYRKHLAQHYTWLSDQDCYGIRCGMLHRGVMDHSVRKKPASPWRKIGFILPDGRGNEFRQLAGDDHYFTGLAEFCRDVVSRVKAWHAAVKNDPFVKQNTEKLMRLHANGVPPYIVGIGILS